MADVETQAMVDNATSMLASKGSRMKTPPGQGKPKGGRTEAIGRRLAQMKSRNGG